MVGNYVEFSSKQLWSEILYSLDIGNEFSFDDRRAALSLVNGLAFIVRINGASKLG